MRRALVLVLKLSSLYGGKALPVNSGCFEKLTAMADVIVGEAGPKQENILSNGTAVKCSWRIETERLVDRIYFTTTYQQFAGSDSLEMFSVGANDEL
jgi:hypothetical protein